MAQYGLYLKGENIKAQLENAGVKTELVEEILGQQSQIQSQEEVISNLKSQRRNINEE